jgi:hypothetical protein
MRMKAILSVARSYLEAFKQGALKLETKMTFLGQAQRAFEVLA